MLIIPSNAATYTVFEIFAVKWPKSRPKISDLGDPWGRCPKTEKTCPGPISTVMQNLTPICATVAEISTGITGRRKNSKFLAGNYWHEQLTMMFYRFV